MEALGYFQEGMPSPKQPIAAIFASIRYKIRGWSEEDVGRVILEGPDGLFTVRAENCKFIFEKVIKDGENKDASV